MSESLLLTPLHAWHKEHGAKMAEFAGWDMPIQYPTGIIAEHMNTRKHVGLFDICHMGEFVMEGAGITEALAKAVCVNLDTLKVGRCRYSFLLNDKGGIIDDLIVYRLEEEKYMLVVNAGCRQIDLETLRKRMPGYTITDISDETAKIDIQGPETVDVLESLIPGVNWRIPYFSFTDLEFDGTPMRASRTGYTGELGFELYVPTDKALKLWELLLTDTRVMAAGLGARDTLRLEAGLPLNGHDISEDHTPFELGYAGMITSTADYAGKAGVDVVKEKLLAFAIPGRRSARFGDKVLNMAGEEVGIVTSGSYSPCLEHSIALAYVKKDKAGDSQYKVAAAKTQLEATVTELPFYKDGTARVKLS